MMSPIDYLVLGHVCEDLTPEGPVLGGSATFAALTARALGMRVGVVTSAPDRLQPLLEPLGPLDLVRIGADEATQFVNTYRAQGREQWLRNRAAPIRVDHVPPDWRAAGIVHLAPVAQELPSSLVNAFPRSLLGVTAQGWLRDWSEDGRVRVRDWKDAPRVLPRADAVVVSIEDLGGNEALAEQYASLARLLVVTRGAAGATLYCRGAETHVPALPRNLVDPTGAGDVFAAALFVRLHRGDAPVAAVEFASRIAADFVTQPQLAGLPPARPMR